MKVFIPDKIHCERCGWSWIPRQAEVRLCPRCKSAYFDTPRKDAARKDDNVSRDAT